MAINEDGLLLAAIEDKLEQSINKYIVTSTSFLDIRQRSLAQRLVGSYKGLLSCFYGGYEDAERTVGVFLPDYATLEEYNPLALLRITQNGRQTLSHRDYLGALMGLGIKREIIGDILVREDGADIVILKDMAEYLIYNYEKAGRTNLNAEIVPINQIVVPEGRFEEKRDTVASLRLDNVVAAAYSLSRTKAAQAITSGLVYVNGIQFEKPDATIKEGDRLVLRGKGKISLKAVGHVTKKDRIVITIEKYI